MYIFTCHTFIHSLRVYNKYLVSISEEIKYTYMNDDKQFNVVAYFNGYRGRKNDFSMDQQNVRIPQKVGVEIKDVMPIFQNEIETIV